VHGVVYIEIYHQGKLVGQHIVPPGRGAWIVDDKHVIPSEKLKKEKGVAPALKPVKVDTRDLSYYNSLIPNG
jgi:hypothetical protein